MMSLVRETVAIIIKHCGSVKPVSSSMNRDLPRAAVVLSMKVSVVCSGVHVPNQLLLVMSSVIPDVVCSGAVQFNRSSVTAEQG